MRISKELEALGLTAEFNKLADEAGRICSSIGDLPVMLFPELRSRLIELTKEQQKVATELYGIYVENYADEIRIDRARECIMALNKQMILLRN